ncbi:MAG: hypothetical protein WCK98_01060 [bacterium]
MFYNKITELTLPLTLVLIFFGVGILILIFKLAKIKIQFAKVYYSLILAFFVNLSSFTIINGNLGGTYQHDSYGFPLTFYTISRDFQWPMSIFIHEPTVFTFDLVRFFVNYLFWLVVVLIITLIFDKMKSTNFKKAE